MQKQYENVFEIKNKNGSKVYARLFDPETKTSEYKIVTEQSIPDIYSTEPFQNNDTPVAKTYQGNIPLYKKSFSLQKNLKDYLNDIKISTGEIKTVNHNGKDISFEEKEFDDKFYGYLDFAHTYINRHFLDSQESIHDHHLIYIDIETRSGINSDGFPDASKALEEVTVIQIYSTFNKTMVVFGRKDFTGVLPENTKYLKIEDEANLLKAFIQYIDKLNPSGLVGFNSDSFDFPYLTNRIARVLDGYTDGGTLKLNQKNSYASMKWVKKLSPVGVVEGIPEQISNDGMESTGVKWVGRFLIDIRELTIKYGFLGLPSYSLDSVARVFGLEGKIDHSNYPSFDSFYTGEGYIFPKDPTEEETKDEIYQAQLAFKENRISKPELEQIVFNRFIEYSIRDVEIMVELNNKAKYVDMQFGIAYITGTSFDDCYGTAKHWMAYMFREGLKNDSILPLKQQFKDKRVPFLAGWVRNKPGKYEYVTSFDFTSLYPSLIRAFNIGADTFIPDFELPDELKELRAKYFTFHTRSNVNRFDTDENGNPMELGNLVKKYKGEISDTQEETDFYFSLLENSEVIGNTLRKYNVCATPNGFFYRKDFQSLASRLMEENFNKRIVFKKRAQVLTAELDKLQKGTPEYNEKLVDLNYNSNMSNVMKTLLNSFYGSMSLGHITFSNGNISASSVTTAGRMCNKIASARASQKIEELSGLKITQELTQVPQVDTDSVVGNTLIYVDGKKIKIEDFFELSDGHIEKSSNNNFIKHPKTNFQTLSWNKENEIIENKKIKYIMAHKVKKRMFRILLDFSNVDVTEDHSVIVKRNSQYIDIKPKDIRKGDKIILKNLEITDNFEVIDLGIQEQWVYDIEVEDNHNFFANDICVHNSYYLSLNNLIDNPKFKDLPDDKKIDVSLKISNDIITPLNQESMKMVGNALNLYNPDALNLENEIIADKFVSLGAKRYFARKVVEDGTILKTPKMKKTGIKIVSKSTPPFIKEKLENVLPIILDKDIEYLKEYINNSLKEFTTLDLKEFARKTKVNNLDYEPMDGKFKKYTGEKYLTAPINSHASIQHNNIIKNNNFTHTYKDIEKGDSISYVYIKEPNKFNLTNAFAWMDENILDEINLKDITDYEKHWEKDFIRGVEIVIKPLKWDIHKKTENLDDW